MFKTIWLTSFTSFLLLLLLLSFTRHFMLFKHCAFWMLCYFIPSFFRSMLNNFSLCYCLMVLCFEIDFNMKHAKFSHTQTLTIQLKSFQSNLNRWPHTLVSICSVSCLSALSVYYKFRKRLVWCCRTNFIFSTQFIL